ncbi:hypothetical protein ACIRQP_33930 [Streptomyces sp. NPDC102274]|uniref:hypothetical protein n=1 Tax=Streptomyces sp. NPDC102274 TaxID=3366151 RepID=UPI00382BEDA7
MTSRPWCWCMGAYADSSSWNGVNQRLRHDAYRVRAAANPLRGLPTDTAALKDVLHSSTARSSWPDTPAAARSSATPRPATAT